MEKMQSQAIEVVYRPCIDVDIVNYINRCPISPNTKHPHWSGPCCPKTAWLAQPMLLQDIPNSLWQEIATSYFNHEGKDYLLICDFSASTYSCIKLHPSQPFPSPKSSKNWSSSMHSQQNLHNQWPSLCVWRLQAVPTMSAYWPHHLLLPLSQSNDFLSTSQDAGTSLDHLLLDLQSNPSALTKWYSAEQNHSVPR